MNYCAVMILLLAVLPGCGRVINWGKGMFNQGETPHSYADEPKKYIRSVTVYDQFATAGSFDALWLSDAVRTAYVNTFAERTGKTDEQKKMLLRRELEENNHFLTFYVLSLFDMPLGDCCSEWTVVLKIKDAIYHPAEVKYIELNPEYKIFLKSVTSRFKNVYQVKFDMKDIDGKPLITPDVEDIKLYFKSIKKDTELAWKIVREDGSLLVRTEPKPFIIRNQRRKDE